MKVECKFEEDKDLNAVKFTLKDGTTRHLVLPKNDYGKKYGQFVEKAVNSFKEDL